MIGSSQEDAEGRDKAFSIGREIAKSGYNLITGACTGLPFAAVEGAREEGGCTIGISPALDEREHVEEYNYPVNEHDVIITLIFFSQENP